MVFVVGDSAFRLKQQAKQAITQVVYGGCYIKNARHPFVKLNQAAALPEIFYNCNHIIPNCTIKWLNTTTMIDKRK